MSAAVSAGLACVAVGAALVVAVLRRARGALRAYDEACEGWPDDDGPPWGGW